MTRFLEKTAEVISELYMQDRDRICVILPNRRGGLYLRKYIAERIDKPVFAPDIFSIEDFVYSLSGFTRVEPLYLLFDFYKVYLANEKNKQESFTDFISWAEIVLSDFSEIDLFNIDPDELFSWLDSFKAISLWEPENNELSEFQKNYLDFFNKLAGLYHKLRAELEKKGQVYNGLAYRKAIENLEKDKTALEWSDIVIAGFNALNTSEKKLINLIRSKINVHLLWDADHYYMDNSIQEAGLFLRMNKRFFNHTEFRWSGDYFREDPKEIQKIGVAGNVGQVKIAGEIVRKIAAQYSDLNNTCIVLNDESLLFPLLNSIPERVDYFNLTMGLSLQNTPMYEFIKSFILLHDVEHSDTGSTPVDAFYYKNMLRMLEHPYMESLFEYYGEGSSTEKLISNLKKSNKVFYSSDESRAIFNDIPDNLAEVIENIFKPWDSTSKNAVKALQQLIDHLKPVFSVGGKEEDNIQKFNADLEYLFHFYKVFNKLDDIVSEFSFVSDLKTFKKILNQLVRTIKIPFHGEPLRGLQIMGLLETRTLDFENVIMLSVNEDLIPGGKYTNSFIPFEVKRKFHLPLQRERNAVFAYHFYRLLQRASNIYLIYNTEPDELGGGEMSRFILQAEHELPTYNPGIRVNEKMFSLPLKKSTSSDQIEIVKSPSVLTRLDELAASGLSPSSLNVFRNCSLQFYFQYITGLRDEDEVEETIDFSTLGSVVHEALANMYKQAKNTRLTGGLIDVFLQNTDKYIKQSFRENYREGDIRFGKNHLIARVVESYIINFLKFEKAFIQDLENEGKTLRILDLENEFFDQITFNNGKQAMLKGKIDRIDSVGSMVRIIDYKTGRVEQRELKLADWNDLMTPGKHDKIFQLLFYLKLYLSNQEQIPSDISAGIFSFRNQSSGLLEIKLPQGSKIYDLPEFSELLERLLSRLFDPSSKFVQTTDPRICEYCRFRGICNR